MSTFIGLLVALIIIGGIVAVVLVGIRASRQAEQVDADPLMERLAEGGYTTGEIDVPVWRADIEADFQAWSGVRRS